MSKEKKLDFSVKQILRCRCRPGYKCTALLHREIEITTCEMHSITVGQKNCGLGHDK